MKKILGFLSVALSGFLMYFFDKIWGSQINWESFRNIKIGDWLLTQIPIRLIDLLAFIILSVIIYLIGKKILKNDSIYTKKQEQLRKINKMEDSTNGYLFRWGVYFDHSNNPFVSDITCFCTKHEGAPLRLVNKVCPVISCSNSKTSINEYMLKNLVESDLIHKWDKIK